MTGESRNADANMLMQVRQSFDLTFDLLSDFRRRCALAYLIEHGGTISLTDLAEEVGVQEHDMPITELSAEEVRKVESSLYHHHIPKLAKAGVVEYDQERGLVRLAEDIEQIERFIALTPTGA